MKKMIAGVAALGLLALAVGPVLALPTKHDFSQGWSGVSGSPVALTGASAMCITCHKPHNAVQNNPLWARSAPTATYTLYTGGQGGMTYDNSATLAAGKSGMCLSCHDGVTAVTGTGVMTSAAALGTGLQNDHPVGVTLLVTAGKYKNPTNLSLSAGKVQCSTCHDPHGANDKMVRVTTALCTECHIK